MLLLHRQGQHLVPHPHLAGAAHGLLRRRPASTYNLPYDVPANQYLTIKGSKVSTSRRLAVWVPDYLSRYDPDPLRYYLSAIMPETADSDFTWAGFVQRNNDELVATWGNLVNRVLTFAYRNFDGARPRARRPDRRRPRADRATPSRRSPRPASTSPPATSAPASRRRWPPRARRTATSRRTRPGS